MSIGGSQQLRLYRRARRDGASVMTACVESGIGMGEARLIETEDAENPPSPEAFQLLVAAPPPPAPPSAPPENAIMARTARKQQDSPVTGEVAKPDFDLAVRLYRQDIKPAVSKVGEHAQEVSTAYKAIKKQAHIQPGAAKLAFKLDDMEPSKRDDFLRGLNGLLRKLNIFMPVDLVDQAEGKGGTADSVIPIGERARPQLATVPTGPAGDQDLLDAASDDNDTPAVAQPIAAE